MYILILALIAAALIAAIAGGVRALWYKHREIPVPPVQTARPEGCCGQHEVCEKESLLAAVSREVEYYDDEELDAFRGRDAASYSPEEIEQFEDVLYTMRDEEVAGWTRSLQLRGVALPEALRDEVLLIVGERREGESVNY